MSISNNDPSKDEMPNQKPRRKSPTAINWRRAAWLIAEGGHPDEVANVIGVGRERLWRHLQTSSRFQGWLREELECRRLMADLQLGAGAKERALMLSRSGEPKLLQAVQKLTDVGQSLHGPERLIDRIADIGKRKQSAKPRKPALKPVKPLVLQAAPGLPRMPANAGEVPRSPAKPSEAPRSPANAGEAQRSLATADLPAALRAALSS